jgi:hypothetical protein
MKNGKEKVTNTFKKSLSPVTFFTFIVYRGIIYGLRDECSARWNGHKYEGSGQNGTSKKIELVS